MTTDLETDDAGTVWLVTRTRAGHLDTIEPADVPDELRDELAEAVETWRGDADRVAAGDAYDLAQRSW